MKLSLYDDSLFLLANPFIFNLNYVLDFCISLIKQGVIHDRQTKPTQET